MDFDHCISPYFIDKSATSSDSGETTSGRIESLIITPTMSTERYRVFERSGVEIGVVKVENVRAGQDGPTLLVVQPTNINLDEFEKVEVLMRKAPPVIAGQTEPIVISDDESDSEQKFVPPSHLSGQICNVYTTVPSSSRGQKRQRDAIVAGETAEVPAITHDQQGENCMRFIFFFYHFINCLHNFSERI